MIDRSKAPAPGTLRMFEFPRVERRQLQNGLKVLTAQSGTLPLVTVRAVLDAGGAAERNGEEGLAWLTAAALEGGTVHRTGDELAWELERLGAQLSTWTTWDASFVQFTTRSDQLAAALELLEEIVRQPAFPQREVDRMREEQLAEILRRSTEPRGLADDAAAHYIYADDATYGRPLIGVPPRVRTFGRDSAVAWHGRRYTPGNAAVIVVGAFDEAAAVAHVQRVFGDWSRVREEHAAPGTDPRTDRTTIFLVDRPSAVQSELRIGHVGVPRQHADYYPLLVLNAIVAGAFTSRLNLNLREKHGFTYGVRSNFSFRRGAGPFVIQTAVASDVTARAVQETLNELNRLLEDGVAEDEVRAARDFIAGTLPLEMQTTEQIAARIAELHTFDLPVDYLDSYRERMGGVTRDDVMRVARAHLHLERLAIVVVGNADAVEADLAALTVGDVIRHESVDA